MTASRWTVVLSEPARDDILGAARYIAEDLANPLAARRLVDALEQAVLSLSAHPARCKPLPLSPWRERGYRILPVRRHLVIYRADEATRCVQIARVFHSSRDWQGVFSGMA